MRASPRIPHTRRAPSSAQALAYVVEATECYRRGLTDKALELLGAALVQGERADAQAWRALGLSR